MDDKIVADLKSSYGIYCGNMTPVVGGWLNKKWKVESDRGTFLVKQYSTKRFSNNQIEQINHALKRQMLLEKRGIPCPYILPYKNDAIRAIDTEVSYMVMSFCPGKSETYDTVSLHEMISLGNTCGAMHKEFGKLPIEGVKGFPICGRQIILSLWENFHARLNDRIEDHQDEYKDAVSSQEEILSHLTADFFDNIPKGIAHEDFTPDNILFDNDSISAIIDFDRNQYSFIYHDIGRAILSFALRDSYIDINKVTAFVNGYATHLPLTLENVIAALRLVWCIEVPWWIRPGEFTSDSEKLQRFRYEILWLTKHWFDLESFISAK
jgi:homoserine kinase type II